MEKEEKLCIKILQTLREMLEKKDSFVEEVFFFIFWYLDIKWGFQNPVTPKSLLYDHLCSV